MPGNCYVLISRISLPVSGLFYLGCTKIQNPEIGMVLHWRPPNQHIFYTNRSLQNNKQVFGTSYLTNCTQKFKILCETTFDKCSSFVQKKLSPIIHFAGRRKENIGITWLLTYRNMWDSVRACPNMTFNY